MLRDESADVGVERPDADPEVSGSLDARQDGVAVAGAGLLTAPKQAYRAGRRPAAKPWPAQAFGCYPHHTGHQYSG